MNLPNTVLLQVIKDCLQQLNNMSKEEGKDLVFSIDISSGMIDVPSPVKDNAERKVNRPVGTLIIKVFNKATEQTHGLYKVDRILDTKEQLTNDRKRQIWISELCKRFLFESIASFSIVASSMIKEDNKIEDAVEEKV